MLDSRRLTWFFTQLSITRTEQVNHMALRIRLQRGGTTHNPVYRIIVAENTAPRDGRFVDIVGTYAPKARGKDPKYRVKLDKIDHWVKQGAKPSDTVRQLINRARREQVAEAEVAS